MKNKKLMILEQVKTNLKLSEESNDEIIYLEGVFTEFNVRNRNNRIYEASDFLPKMEELRPRIAKHTLLGELDHPTNFDVSLKNASHVIENLTYDQQNNRVIGKIRLLNTKAGKDAQALVRDGIPLHISSRAAGSIDANGKVTLEKLFTYDLVADPGFENAELKRVNESYTFGGGIAEDPECLNECFGLGDNEDVRIYECEYDDIQENNTFMNMDKNTVSVDCFQKYTEYIAGVIESVKVDIDKLNKKIGGVNESAGVDLSEEKATIAKLTKYVDYLAEELEKTQKHSDYLAEELEKTQKHNDYLAEEVEKGQNYSEYLAEQLQKNCDHNDYLAEQVEKSINYSDYLAENIENNINYSDYLAEQLQKNCDHNDYLAEQLQMNCDHNDYLAEKLNQNFAHNDYLAEQLQRNCDHNDYLAEKLEQNFAHNDYLAEKLNQNFAHNDYLAEKLEQNYKHNDYLAEQLEKNINAGSVNEGKSDRKPGRMINEGYSAAASKNADYKSSISEKLDAIMSRVDEQVAPINFMNLISENRQREFAGLDADTQKLITEAMNAAKVKNEAQADVVWKSVYESKKGLDIVENMPEVCKAKWEALSDERKNEILNEAKFYDIKSQNEINYFWSTRDLREKQMVVERVDTDSAKMWENNTNEHNDYIASVLGKTQRSMRGY